MNNFIKYFYGFDIDKVIYNDKYYSFIYGGYVYRLYIYNGTNEEINFLYEVNRQLVGNTLMSEFVINMNNEIVSSYNGVSYVLMRVFVNVNKRVTLNEISFVSRLLGKGGMNVDWGLLWSKKID